MNVPLHSPSPFARALVLGLALVLSLPVLAAEAQRLLYRDEEPGIDPYVTRILVTPGHLRMDYGEDKDDFLLYDRAADVAYNVVHSASNIVVIKSKPVVARDDSSMKLEQREQPTDAPDIEGRKVRHWVLTVNGNTCTDLLAVEGLAPDAVDALKGLNLILAAQRADSMKGMPADLHNECDATTYVHAPTRHLDFGLPVGTRNFDGRARTLMDIRVLKDVEEVLFTLPEGYQRFEMGLMGH